MSLYSDLNEVLTPYAQRIKGLGSQIGEVNESLGDVQADLSNSTFKPVTFTMTDGGVYVNTETNAIRISSDENHQYTFVDVTAGESYKIHTGVYGSLYYGVLFADSSNCLIERYGSQQENVWGEKDIYVTVPQGASKMYVNNTDYSAYHTDATIHKVLSFESIDYKYDEANGRIDDNETYLEMGYVAKGEVHTSSDSYTAIISVSQVRVKTTTNSSFVTKKYPVESGRRYKLIGENANIHYDTYALAAFSESDFDGTTDISCTLIVYGSGATSTNYNVNFVAPANGYIYITQYRSLNTVSLYDSEYVSSLIYGLTNTKLETVKLQAFGDSITDDSWRSDGTTWLTLLPEYFPQRTWEISNDAVGGSHMGHGKVNSNTGKYHDLEYNYVYDLITNDDIFKSDSDIIVIFAGTNDFNSSPLGTYGDTGLTTFYGAIKSVCEYLSANTSALVFFVTPIARPTDADESKSEDENGEKINSYGATLRDYANAIIRTCEFYQFPVIDLFHEIGWNAANVKPYLDAIGVHPKKKGSKVISQLIVGKIKQYFAM